MIDLSKQFKKHNNVSSALCSSLDDLNGLGSIGSILLSFHIEGYSHLLAKTFSKWVAKYNCHVPNIDNYKTIAVYTLDGQFCFAYDSHLNLIVNNLDLNFDYSREFFESIEKKVNEMKAKK